MRTPTPTRRISGARSSTRPPEDVGERREPCGERGGGWCGGERERARARVGEGVSAPARQNTLNLSEFVFWTRFA